MSDDQYLPCKINVHKNARGKDGTLVFQLHHNLANLRQLPEDSLFSAFASMWNILACLSRSRPNCLFEIGNLTQVNPSAFTDDSLTVFRLTNKLARFAADNKRSLLFPPIYVSSLKVVGISYASVAGIRYQISQLGYTVFIG